MADGRAASIEIIEVTKRFGSGEHAVTAVEDVSLTIEGGEFFTLLGPSGCGKTTLLRLIAGFEEPTAGEIRLAGRRLSGLPPFRRAVNTVFQSYALFPHLTVARNVAFGLEMQKVRPAEVRREVATALALVRLGGLEHRYPRELSGGQQQRVALARALANHPRVLLLDEPLSALDLKLRKEMQGELRRLRAATGITFLFVTHDQEEALTLSDRLAVMDQGRVLQVGTPETIYDRPASRFVADFIGEANLLDAVCAARANGEATFRLVDGAVVTAASLEGVAPGDAVTLAVRPERIVLGEATADGLPATVETAVYLGSDTICEVRLASGAVLRARLQNRQGARGGLSQGCSVAARIPADAVRVFKP